MNRARKERISAIGSVIILLGIAFLIQIVTIVNKYC